MELNVADKNDAVLEDCGDRAASRSPSAVTFGASIESIVQFGEALGFSQVASQIASKVEDFVDLEGAG